MSNVARLTGYWCSNCNRVCCWECEEHDGSIDEIKTVGSRYCNDEACLVVETRENGISRERIDGYYLRRKLDARPCVHLVN